MFLKTQLAVLYGLTIISVNASAGGYSVVAMGAFGQPLTNCMVESFRLTGAAQSVRHDYRGSFRGLIGSDLPDGEYQLAVLCREARLEANVLVDDFHRFEVITENRRIMRSDHLIPQLTIRTNQPRPPGEVWWVTLRGLYGNRTYTATFQTEAGEARIPDPEPGAYLVIVLSNTGYECFREIDFMERSRLWTFNASGCVFGLDPFAHLVTEEDKHEHKKTKWYRALEQSDDEFFRALDKAAKTPDKIP